MKAALRRPGKASAASAAGGTGSAASAHDRHVYILTSSATLAGVQTTLCTAALLSCTTAAWCILAGLDHREQHAGRRSQWFALLLAPFGAVLRWLLSGYNSRLPRPLHWFPAGTFAANMLACGIDYVLMAVTVHARLGYWPLVLLPAVRVGFSGALSTVSTFVAEVHGQLKLLPDRLYGYMYTFASLATGAILGVVLYGWGTWA